MKLYCAIIGDIVDSRQYQSRLNLQNDLKRVMSNINIEYGAEAASKFSVTLGDEFQGLLKRPDTIFDIVDMIMMQMHPVKIRFGIGIGEITTEIDPEMSVGADGPAYYCARDMINQIRTEEKGRENPKGNIKFSAGSYSSQFNEDLIKAVLALYSLTEKKWTESQREKIYEYMKHQDTQRDISKRLEVGVSSVNRGLKNAGFYNYLFAKNTMQNYLKEQWEKMNV
ncbi:MAG: SatD family protein [Eubacteriales bacterium]